jgi:hypothetical protein
MQFARVAATASRDAEIDAINFCVRAGNAFCHRHKTSDHGSMLITSLPIRKSVGCPALQEVAIAMLRHPLGARQVALPGALRALGFLRRIDVQDDARDFGPIRTLGIGIEEAEIGDEMLLVIILALRMCLMAAD